MSDKEKEAAQTEHKPEWGPIIKDMVILMVIMGCLGTLCKVAMLPFEHKYEADAVVSLIGKGDLKFDEAGRPMDTPFSEAVTDLAEGAGINVQDNTGRTPLMWAVYANFNNPKEAVTKDELRYFYVSSLLSTPGIDVHARDNDGFTAMHWASWSGMPYSILQLANAGADVNAAESNGYTPLMLAAMRGDDEAVEVLLSLGANPAAKNAEGKTALELIKDAESAYNKREEKIFFGTIPFYDLIFSPDRKAAYERAHAMLDGKVKPAALEEVQKRTLDKINTYWAERAKKAAKDAEQPAEAAEEAPAAPEAK